MQKSNSIVILIADDDAEDRMLVKEALEESKLINEIKFVEDGEELLDYLHTKESMPTRYSTLHQD